MEGTAFYVWEDFDFSQINTDGYTEGEPDGSTGEVYLNRMLPEPETGYICDTINTDIGGQASHSDVRQYDYSKTYCMGHPAPEWIECTHEGGDGEEEGEDCSCGSGWQSRNCAQPPVISMCRMIMRMTTARTRKPCRPCWRTGTRPMRIISIWNTAIICRRRLPGQVIYYMGYIMMTKR